MDSYCDEIGIILSGRTYIYRMLKHVFGHEPNLQLIETLTGEFTEEALALFLDDEQLAPYNKLFAKIKNSISGNSEATLECIKSEYTNLMLGPYKLPAPPWESVYVNKVRLIFQKSTLKVRQAYLEYNLLPSEYPHVPDDHIAIELDFMLRLGQFCQESFVKSDAQRFHKILSDQKLFLENHILVWIYDFAEQIQQSKTHHFYPQMASLTANILQADYNIIEELEELLSTIVS